MQAFSEGTGKPWHSSYDETNWFKTSLHPLVSANSVIERYPVALSLPIGPIVVHFWCSYLESYKAIPKRNY